MDINAYIRQLRKGLRHVAAPDRDAILSEVRGHLEERVAALRSEGMPRQQAVREAIESFGPAHEVAVQYQDGKAMVRGRSSALAVTLRAGRAAGRGVGKVVKFVAVTLVVVLVAALVVAAAVAIAYKDVVQQGLDEVSDTSARQLFDREEQWDQPHTGTERDAFHLGDVRTAQVSIDAQPSSALGCLQVTVYGPADKVLHDSGRRCGTAYSYSFGPAEPGSYRIEYTFAAWQGTLEAHGFAVERMPE